MNYVTNINSSGNNLNSKNFRAVKDFSSDIMTRNYLSIHHKDERSALDAILSPQYKIGKSVHDINKKYNSYLDPISQYENQEKCNLSPLLCNSGVYSMQKKKIYSYGKMDQGIKDNSSINILGQLNERNKNCVSKDNFEKLKINSSPTSNYASPERKINFNYGGQNNLNSHRNSNNVSGNLIAGYSPPMQILYNDRDTKSFRRSMPYKNTNANNE